jgi:hypothetical protein
MRVLRFGMIAVLATAGFADTVTLRNGQVINGTYLGGTARQVRVETGDQIRTLDVSDVVKIEFTAPAVSQAAAPVNAAPAPAPAPQRSLSTAQPAAVAPKPEPLPRRAPATSATPAPQSVNAGPVELPSGTNLVIRMIDGVDSETNSVGQTFAASIDEPVMVDGNTVIPRGSDVVAVDKEGDREPAGHEVIEGDTVDVLNAVDVPIIVGIGDPGKMNHADESKKGARITTKAVEAVLRLWAESGSGAGRDSL